MNYDLLGFVRAASTEMDSMHADEVELQFQADSEAALGFVAGSAVSFARPAPEPQTAEPPMENPVASGC